MLKQTPPSQILPLAGDENHEMDGTEEKIQTPKLDWVAKPHWSIEVGQHIFCRQRGSPHRHGRTWWLELSALPQWPYERDLDKLTSHTYVDYDAQLLPTIHLPSLHPPLLPLEHAVQLQGSLLCHMQKRSIYISDLSKIWRVKDSHGAEEYHWVVVREWHLQWISYKPFLHVPCVVAWRVRK